MCGCERRYRDCDDALLDRLNGVGDWVVGNRRGWDKDRRDDIRFVSDPCRSGWVDVCAVKGRRRCCCDFCWLRWRCPYHCCGRD